MKDKEVILVVGGAGYVGSHMVRMLHEAGYQVVTFDDLSNGHRSSVLAGNFIEGTLADKALLDQVFSIYDIKFVMHFASFIEVGESVREPAKYYHNNVVNTLNLLDTMVKHDVKKFVFSSTAAIFGQPETSLIDENHAKQPINPYGCSKLMIEQILSDYDHAYGLKSVCLRYFNAAGASVDGRIGERHEPETHLIPLVLQVAAGIRQSISIFGDDYATRDGTCIRDYIHIVDLCQAHLLALKKLEQGHSAAYNLGNGNGFSVREVIETARKVTGHPIPAIVDQRRPGDPAVLVADSQLARQELGWSPNYRDLVVIIQHAWAWEKTLPRKMNNAAQTLNLDTNRKVSAG